MEKKKPQRSNNVKGGGRSGCSGELDGRKENTYIERKSMLENHRARLAGEQRRVPPRQTVGASGDTARAPGPGRPGHTDNRDQGSSLRGSPDTGGDSSGHRHCS